MLAQLAVNSSQFGFTTSANGIITQTAITETQISTNSAAINLQNYTHFTINGNEITSATLTGTTGIAIGTGVPTSGGIITGNEYFGWATGVNLSATAVNVAVVSNRRTNNTANETNTCGASCTITPNY